MIGPRCECPPSDAPQPSPLVRELLVAAVGQGVRDWLSHRREVATKAKESEP